MAGGLTLCHAMKSITPNLAVGGEGFYHLHKPLKGASLAARAMLGLWLGLGQVNPNPNPNPNPDPNPSQARRAPLLCSYARYISLYLPYISLYLAYLPRHGGHLLRPHTRRRAAMHQGRHGGGRYGEI